MMLGCRTVFDYYGCNLIVLAINAVRQLKGIEYISISLGSKIRVENFI